MQTGWNPSRRQVLINPQTLNQSWIQAGGERIYLSSPEQDKVPQTREPKREWIHPLEQKQILLPTRQVEAVEAENCAHDVAEVQQIQQEHSQSFVETKLEVTQGYQGTLQKR